MRERIGAVLDGGVDYEAGLDSLTVAPPAEVDTTLLAILRENGERLWRGGWQPVELHRVVARRSGPPVPDLVTDAVAAHLSRTRPVDPRWREQADALGATVWWGDDYLGEFARRHRLDRTAVLDLMLTLLGILRTLPRIEVLIPPPGTAARAPARHLDSKLVHRVRALLAKAESSAFPAEAETYTAKAQELIARHSIDEALVSTQDGGPAVVPFARRVGVDHPYENEKASLLHAVADANRCRTVWSPELGFSTVFGYDADLDAVELLYASLLVQANRAMAQAEPAGRKANKARVKTFRRSFLVAFAVRVGERLADAAVPVSTDANLLPVLADRDAQVRETMERVFPRTTRVRGSRVDSEEGWDSGVEAADRVGLT
ncbi:hypothetical protein Val02_18080 [Virgisporangium aliadipatigenens]|uniref:PI-PLC Y-box domain-containing protein n=1 Tax=Virgisporangium aliadipatigenens TaxID=741659 RepID=A0A8J4DQ00_9ACTN|nr:DUF2786 domain-containing protein [Virgisporangium aliadipatigenens]GIJ44922.1 hypothetical protein Val02_18080 [Virgisporangium aliadipatigenens]